MKKYVAAFYEENGGNYSVFLADYDAATCGDDIEDAREMAKDILSIYIEDEGAKEQPKRYKTKLRSCRIVYRKNGPENVRTGNF